MAGFVYSNSCVECHKKKQPNIVIDWELSKHSQVDVDCATCHGEAHQTETDFAVEQINRGDQMIKEVDHLLAQAILEIAGLYKDGIIKKPENYAYNFPNLLTFHDAPTVVEQILFEMHLKHRMRAFQGVFHANPDYALWYGWSEMQRDLTEIKTIAVELRRIHGK